MIKNMETQTPQKELEIPLALDVLDKNIEALSVALTKLFSRLSYVSEEVTETKVPESIERNPIKLTAYKSTMGKNIEDKNNAINLLIEAVQYHTNKLEI